jgi:hypothetical protein
VTRGEDGKVNRRVIGSSPIGGAQAPGQPGTPLSTHRQRLIRLPFSATEAIGS